MKKVMRFLIVGLFVSVMTLSGKAYARTVTVALDRVETELKKAQPGDKIVIQNGVYNDCDLKWTAKGTAGRPVLVSAETAGGVVIKGRSRLRFAGEWMEIDGLVFEDGVNDHKSVIEYRHSGEVANNCRVTNCVIRNMNPEKRETQTSYVLLYGRNNRFDHNSLLEKYNLGVTLIVILDEERNQQNYHKIDHNYFGPRPVYGSNGAETVRVGTSHHAEKSSNTIVEDNFFDRCNGEVEVVSIKSSDNVVRGNMFWECQGVIALRHGDRNVVEKNILVGNGVRNTGGVRVVNAGHKIIDNRFYGLAGERFFSALALMNAVPNSLPNRYNLVDDIEVAQNVFWECSNIEFGTGRDLERTLQPERVLLRDNVIINPNLTEPFIVVDDISGFEFRNNKVDLGAKTNIEGFKDAKIKIVPAPNYETMAEGRGAGYSRIALIEIIDMTKIVEVSSVEQLVEAVEGATSGVQIKLQEGSYALPRTLVVMKNLAIMKHESASTFPVISYAADKSGNMIEIADGVELSVSGITFDGRQAPGKPSARSMITSSEGVIKPYSVKVAYCEFRNTGGSGNVAIGGAKNTFANRVEIENCKFYDMSGTAIDYAAENDEMGRYSAEDVIITNCSFYRLLGPAINICRGGSDESTAGPYVEIHNCNFEDVCNRERGSVMRLIGAQVMNIVGCNFSNSGRGGVAIRLNEATWEKITIENCNFWNSGRILTMTDNVVKGEMHNIEPKYNSAENLDFSIALENRLSRLGVGVNVWK